MGKKSAPPPPPDYTAAANAQAAASEEMLAQQTWANRPDISTPWGSQTWQVQSVRDPATGEPVTNWMQSTNLHPDLQAALDAQISLQTDRSQLAESFQDRVADDFKDPFRWGEAPAAASNVDPTIARTSLDQAPPISMGLDDAGDVQRNLGNYGDVTRGIDPTVAYAQRAEDAFYDRATSRLDPAFEQREADMHALLVNQGFKPGDEGYDRAMGNLNRERTDAYGAATRDAILEGGREAQRLQGMDLASGQFANQAQAQAFGQGLAGSEFANLAQQQAFGQGMAGNQFANQAQAQAFGQGLAGAEFENAAANSLYNQALSSAQFQNQNRQQWLAEEAMRRNMSLNEMNALLTGQQVGMPNIPTFQPAGVAETPQLLNAANMQYGSELDRYNAQQAAAGGFTSGLFDLGAGYLSGGGSFGFG